jgi:hypothetical protein
MRRGASRSTTWAELERVAAGRRLPERAVHALYPAGLGLKVRRPVFEVDAEIELGTANRDLRMMVEAGLLVAQGETRGRFYLGTPELRQIRQAVVGERPALRDPYPDSPARGG